MVEEILSMYRSGKIKPVPTTEFSVFEPGYASQIHIKNYVTQIIAAHWCARRSGPKSKQLYEIPGCPSRVHVVQGDVSSSSDVEKAVTEFKALGPIRGVVHAAMGLHEDLFGRMSDEG
ncbi:unnamed protein product [Clonostachys chloroleuca]|uniref:Ketoreductase (KR) domain-containing protein n=1 Tax=Clonostachys chloroleuca TaxID=1926264 RepID=A0AA35M2W3_9HYPO|nr:unnamed protein product [Clonostachys chloroleuca]